MIQMAIELDLLRRALRYMGHLETSQTGSVLQSKATGAPGSSQRPGEAQFLPSELRTFNVRSG